VSYLPVPAGRIRGAGDSERDGKFFDDAFGYVHCDFGSESGRTDIVNVKNWPGCDATIDAIPGKVFKGKVTEIGSQAVLRSSGLATTQTTTSNQEAKDFKVVVTLASPPENLRPGFRRRQKSKRPRRRV